MKKQQHFFPIVIIGVVFAIMISQLSLSQRSDASSSPSSYQVQAKSPDRRRRPRPTPSPKPSPTATPTPAPTPTPVPSTPPGAGGFPFGPYNLPTSEYGKSVYTGGFLYMSNMSVTEAQAALDAARSKNMKLIISLAGGGQNFEDAAHNYSFDAFTSAIDRYKTLDLSKYTDVVMGNLIMDEPQDPTNWGGQAVTTTQIKQAANYVKSLWPSIPVGVGTSPSYVGSEKWSSSDLDFVSTQFTEKKLNCNTKQSGCYGSSVDQWVSGVIADAKAQGLGLVLSINALDGGTPNGAEMTSANVQTYGQLFAQQTYACALNFWKWDSSYFNKSDVQTAFASIASTARTRSSTACKQH